MSRPIRRMSAVLAVLLVALLANLAWVQVLDADALRQHDDNTRAVLEQYNRARGPIIVGSSPIATSARSTADGFYQRSYTEGPVYAAVTGYSSLLYGTSGIERSQNALLSGTDSRLFVDRIQQLLAGRRQAGGAVTLSLDADAQHAAYSALAGTRGALVAIDATTGAILALVSTPSFDPQELAPNDPTQVRAAYDAYAADPGKPMLNRAVARAYPAGSVFHVITAAAALAAGGYSADTLLPGPASYQAGDVAIRNASDRACGSSVSLQRALRTRCSTAFAWLGAQLGSDALRGTAELFGFDTAPTIALPVTASRISGDANAALTATGGSVRATVLQLAMVMAAISNDGSLMTPYLIADVRAQNLAVLDHAKPVVHTTPLSVRGSRALASMLAGIDGRTDCADCTVGSQPVHVLTTPGSDTSPTWAVGFAGRVAVAVAVESGSPGSRAQVALLDVMHAIVAKG